MILLLLACASQDLEPDSDAEPCAEEAVEGTVWLWGAAYSDAVVTVRVEGAEPYTLQADELGAYRTQVPPGVPVGLMAQDPDGYCQSPEENVTLEDCELLELDLFLPEECALPG